ncbi:uncharacterized protein LOC144744693 [Ciona intestinalis]
MVSIRPLLVLCFLLVQVYGLENVMRDLSVVNQTTTLALKYRCNDPDEFIYDVTICLTSFARYSQNMTSQEICDFKLIWRSYDTLSRCINASTSNGNCWDRYALFDDVMRSVTHPQFFNHCDKIEELVKPNNKHTVYVIIGLSCFLSVCGIILANYLVSMDD